MRSAFRAMIDYFGKLCREEPTKSPIILRAMFLRTKYFHPQIIKLKKNIMKINRRNFNLYYSDILKYILESGSFQSIGRLMLIFKQYKISIFSNTLEPGTGIILYENCYILEKTLKEMYEIRVNFNRYKFNWENDALQVDNYLDEYLEYCFHNNPFQRSLIKENSLEYKKKCRVISRHRREQVRKYLNLGIIRNNILSYISKHHLYNLITNINLSHKLDDFIKNNIDDEGFHSELLNYNGLKILLGLTKHQEFNLVEQAIAKRNIIATELLFFLISRYEIDINSVSNNNIFQILLEEKPHDNELTKLNILKFFLYSDRITENYLVAKILKYNKKNENSLDIAKKNNLQDCTNEIIKFLNFSVAFSIEK